MKKTTTPSDVWTLLLDTVREKGRNPVADALQIGKIEFAPEVDALYRNKIRQFKTGATRDTDEDKCDLEGYLSPIVLQEFAAYMQKHQRQANGELRSSDNWQKHFGDDHYAVCIKSAWRHFMDLWLEHRGFKSRDGIEAALMGLLFNVMAYADKYYKAKLASDGHK